MINHHTKLLKNTFEQITVKNQIQSIYLATVIDKVEGGILLTSYLPLNKLTVFSTRFQQVSKLQLSKLTCVNGYVQVNKSRPVFFTWQPGPEL